MAINPLTLRYYDAMTPAEKDTSYLQGNIYRPPTTISGQGTFITQPANSGVSSGVNRTASTNPYSYKGTVLTGTTAEERNAQARALAGYGTPTAPVAPTASTDTPITNRYDMTNTEGLLSGAERERAFINKEDIARQAEEIAAKQRQAQIDAINALYAPKYAKAEDEASREKARARALALRSGQMGSGENPYQVAGAEELSKAKLAELDASKQAQIQMAFGSYDTMRQKETERLLAEKTASAEDKIKYYKDITDNAIAAAKQWGAGGITLDELKQKDPQAYQDLKDVGGMSDFDIAAQMAEGNPAINAKIEYQDGVAYIAYVDPATGKLTTQTQQVGPLDTGEEFKSIDGVGYAMSKDANGKISLRALTGQDSKTTSTKTSTTFTSSDYSKIEADIKQYGLDNVVAGLTPEQAQEIQAKFGGFNPNLSIGATPGLGFDLANKSQMDKTYVTGSQNVPIPPKPVKVDLTGYTPTDKKKLEQAGLLNSDRQTQLDYLYGKKETTTSAPSSSSSMTDEEFLNLLKK